MSEPSTEAKLAIEQLELIRARHRVQHPSRPSTEPIARPIGETLNSIAAKIGERDLREEAQPTRVIRRPMHQESVWSNAGFPLRHRQREQLDLEDWPAEASHRINAASTWISNNDSLLLVGPRGTGKTQLATQLARQWFESEAKTVRYIRVFDMLNQIKRAAYDENKPRPDHDWVSCGLLVIDELHEQRMSEDDALWFGTVFDKRYADMKPTILISNLQPEGVAELVGKSAWSRMQECARVVVCDWASFRAKAGV